MTMHGLGSAVQQAAGTVVMSLLVKARPDRARGLLWAAWPFSRPRP